MKNKSSLPTHVPKHMVGMFLVFGAAVVLAVLVAGCWMWRSEVPQRLNRLPNPATLPQMPEAPPYQTTAEPVSEVVPSDNSASRYMPLEQFLGRTSWPDLRQVTLDVDWQKPQKVSVDSAFGSLVVANQEALALENNGSYRIPGEEKVYLRGIVRTAPFNGARIYSYSVPCDGMCFVSDIVSYVMVTPEKTVFNVLPDAQGDLFSDIPDSLSFSGRNEQGLPLYSVTVTSTYPSPTTVLYRLNWSELPDVLMVNNGQKLYREPKQNYSLQDHKLSGGITLDCWVNGCANFKKVGTAKTGQVIYRPEDTPSDRFTVFGADGVATIYTSGPVANAYDQNNGKFAMTSSTFMWDAAYQNEAAYTAYYSGGCGGADYRNVITVEELRNSDLVKIGTSVDGQVLYGVKEYFNHPLTMKAYDSWFAYGGNGEKPSLEEFLKRYPVPFFIVKNFLGENVQLILSDSVVGAECGKPVIYLYPPKTTNVSVKLGSNINVTVSEPTYPAQGWNVVARPNGDLLYQGQTYGSLFWEGTGVGYEVPKTGFLIKDGQVDQQLKVILAKYGLNEKESAEFREFWVPKMTGAKYYRVSFVETAAWNKAAPLAVSPRPTSVLRIFMDWQKLSAPIQIQEPKIQPFVRDGFTLVEWGGLLRK